MSRREFMATGQRGESFATLVFHSISFCSEFFENIFLKLLKKKIHIKCDINYKPVNL